MSKKKTIFMFLDLYAYLILETKEGYNDSTAHASALMLFPDTDGNYSAFYFNPHGRAILDTKTYEYYISRYRKKEYKLKKSVDIFAVNHLVKCFNTYISKNVRDSKSPIKVSYNHTKYHNYLGANLQAGDNYGVCFTFPLLVCYELCMHYNDVTYLEDNTCNMNRRYPSYATLAKRKDYHRIMLIMLSKYFVDISQVFLHNKIKVSDRVYEESYVTIPQDEFNAVIEKIVENKNTIYIKVLINMFTGFLMQDYLKKLIDN
jgi:hypothetical protein